MLFLLIGVLFIASVLVLCVKKSKDSIFLLGMCISLMLQFAGNLLLIAKKGGYPPEVMNFLFFSQEIKTHLQYLLITLDSLGYLIALGRYLFPLFLMEMALSYSMIPFIRQHAAVKKWALLLPVLSLILYWPGIFKGIVSETPNAQDVMVQFSYIWILVYVALALFLLVFEYFSITMRFCRRQFSQIVICMVALSGLYILYCGQDPAQVYRFYSYSYLWIKGIGYLQYAPSVPAYIVLVVTNVICGILGFTSLLRYTQGTYVNDRDDVVMERKFDIARSGASVFVHSIKNQLLANRVLFKRLHQEMEKETPDPERMRQMIASLNENNEGLISRSEELYLTVKSKSVILVPVPLRVLGEAALDRFYKKYPDGKAEVYFADGVEVLADKNYLSEALYNLLINAWEANLMAENTENPVQMISHEERLYTVIEVKDRGAGITRADQKRIFEPFYSSKNSNFNWGMGLFHVRAIVKAHLGSLRVESAVGLGTSFFVLLPKYGQPKQRRKKA